GTGSFSYAMWVYEFSTTPLGSWDMPWWKGGSSLGRVGFDMELGSSDWYANISDGTNCMHGVFSATPIYDTWVHLVAVVDRAAGQLKVYKDGAFVTQTALGSFGSVSSTWSAGVGAAVEGGTPSSQFHGKIDDVRIYNYALSAAEVSTLYGGC